MTDAPIHLERLALSIAIGLAGCSSTAFGGAPEPDAGVDGPSSGGVAGSGVAGASTAGTAGTAGTSATGGSAGSGQAGDSAGGSSGDAGAGGQAAAAGAGSGGSGGDGATSADGGACDGVDCSHLDDECSIGVCAPDTGQCSAAPRNEGAPCGVGTICTPGAQCGGFDDECDESGTKSNTCRDFTCVAGQCEEGAPYAGSPLPCTRNTDGVECGSPTTSCGSCGGFSGPCDESGTKTCTDSEFRCASGTCKQNDSPRSESCQRSTDGITCGSTSSGCFGEEFRPVCCSNGSCTQTGSSCGLCQL